MSMDQSLLVAEAAESLAAYALREDPKSGSKTDDPSEAVGPADRPARGSARHHSRGVCRRRHRQVQSRTAWSATPDRTGKEVVDPIALAETGEPRCEQVGIDAKWASLIADWIDPDSQPLPDGAEDSLYAIAGSALPRAEYVHHDACRSCWRCPASGASGT